jgi:ABC-type phosphate transport system substrate-binding protein
LNKIQKTLVAIMIIAMMAFSTAAIVGATWINDSTLKWFDGNNDLYSQGTLNIFGSSTVGPIASEESGTGNFANYWNNLVTNNPSLGTAATVDLSSINIKQDGSGTAIPALSYATGQADVGEMSRPPSTGEWGTLDSLQLWAVGVDSVAIVLSPDMTWFPTDLTTNQAVSLFVDNDPTNTTNQGINGNTGSTPMFTTWNQFLNYWGLPQNAEYGNATIQRAVRDPTSGTYDCFSNYFATPNGYSIEYKTGNPSIAVGAQEMAPYTYCQQNGDVYTTVSAGAFGTTGDYVGFISVGYLETYGNMIGLNIAFNNGHLATPTSYIHYYGVSGTYGAPGGTWSGFVTPNDANIKWAYSGVQGTFNGVPATGQYEAWRWLWEVTPGPISFSSTGDNETLAAGVWIAYMMATGTTNAGTLTTPATLAPGGVGTGNSNFIADQNYIPLCRADMAGAQPLDSNLNIFNSTSEAPYLQPTQTQTIPDGQVNGHDFFYFVNAYINYYGQHVYNPYADINANGVIDGHDFFGFVNAYISYFTTYNPS